MRELTDRTPSVGGIILAAGESRRMGGNPKALLLAQAPAAQAQAQDKDEDEDEERDEKSFVVALIDAYRLASVSPVIVVVGHEPEKIIEHVRAKRPETQLVVNEAYRSGMLSSIQRGLRAIRKAGSDASLVCPVDHPGVQAKSVRAVIEAYTNERPPVVIPIHNGRRGHPVLFDASVFSELDEASAEIGARQVVWAHQEDILEIHVSEPGVLADIDTPELYRAFRETGAQGVAQEVACLEPKPDKKSGNENPNR